MMESYEIRFYGPQGTRSICCFALFPSDRHALDAARKFLDVWRPTATVWQGERRVGDVHRAAPLPPLHHAYPQARSSGINIG
jgi:hypothetical protein